MLYHAHQFVISKVGKITESYLVPSLFLVSVIQPNDNSFEIWGFYISCAQGKIFLGCDAVPLGE